MPAEHSPALPVEMPIGTGLVKRDVVPVVVVEPPPAWGFDCRDRARDLDVHRDPAQRARDRDGVPGEDDDLGFAGRAFAHRRADHAVAIEQHFGALFLGEDRALQARRPRGRGVGRERDGDEQRQQRERNAQAQAEAARSFALRPPHRRES